MGDFMLLVSFFWLLSAGESVPFADRNLKGAALSAHIEETIQAHGGTPVIEDNVFHFFYRAEKEVPRIDGDFTFWSRGRNQFGIAMTELGDGWYHYGLASHPQARVEYVFRLGDEVRTDPRNAHVVKGWSNQVSVAQMPDYPSQPELLKREDTARGELTTFSFKSDIRRNQRDIHVYTPPGYDKEKGNFPVLYFGDGTPYVERALLPQILDNLIADKTIPPVIAVFIDPVDRWLEYRMSTLYRSMMLEELIPHLAKKWRLDQNKQILIGGSRGGLGALDLALNHPDRFAGVVAIAPAVTGTDFTTQLRRMQVDLRPRFAILIGTYDFWRSSGLEVVDVMQTKGYRLSVREAHIGHTINAWVGYLDELLPDVLNGH